MSTFEDYGYTVAEVQSIMAADLHPVILLAFCHGLYTCIFFIALYYIIESTQPDRKRITLASIISFLWATNTVLLSLNWDYVGQLFIAHGTSLEAEFFFEPPDDVASQVAISVLRGVSVLVADLIVIWRCYVLYGRSLKIIVIPSLCVITETIGACMIIVTFVADRRFVGDSQANWSLIYYSMTVATNSLCTILILFRVVQVRGISASLKTYRGIIEILVESAAMYAVVYLALLVAYAYQYYHSVDGSYMTAYKYPVVVSYSITGIAPTLIIARVMAGKARPDDSWTRPSLPHIRTWRTNVLSASESLRFASAPNQSTRTTTTNTGSINIEAQAEHRQDGDEDRVASASHHPDKEKV